MFPFRHRSIFRSRWIALFWAAGIIWFAYNVASAGGGEARSNVQATDATGAPVTQQDVDALRSAINQI